MPLQGSLSIERMCQLAGVSRAGFYRSLQERVPIAEDMEVRSVIQQIAVEHRRRYGYRRISAELRRRGMLVNHKRVLRILREDNLPAVQRRAFVMTTDSDHELEVYLNLASRMKLTGMNQLWVADITYIRLQKEFVYLAVILTRFRGKWWAGRWTEHWRAGCRSRLWTRPSCSDSPRQVGASFRSWRAVRFWRVREGLAKARDDPEHESASEPLRQGLRFTLHLFDTLRYDPGYGSLG